MYKAFIKPILDFVIALIVFICFMPLIILVIISLAVANKGEVFFLQQRPGLKGKPFRIIKFKTMNDACDDQGKLLPASMRITKVGALVRKTSIDELPQLINVLKGNLSLVGPRPLRMEYLPLYSEEQMRRHDVKPGITGWAQVNGRNAISWEDKFKYDVFYVDNLSFRLDLKIIAMTIRNVLIRKDINDKDNKIVKPFKGVKLNG